MIVYHIKLKRNGAVFMRKCTVVFLILIVRCSCILFAHGSSDSDSSVMHVSALNGPGGVLLSAVCADSKDVSAAAGCPVLFDVVPSVDAMLARLIKAETDIAVLPVQIAAKVYKKSNGAVKLCAVTGNSMFYFVSAEAPAIMSLSNLKNKTLYCAGHGATPEYVMQFLMNHEKCGDSIALDFSVSEPELAAFVAAKKATCALLPEPFVTAAVASGAIRGVGLHTLWKNDGQGDTFPVTVLVVRSDYAQTHRTELNAFLSYAEVKAENALRYPAQTASYAAASGITVAPDLLERAIPFCSFCFIPARTARASIESLFTSFLLFSPDAVGGTLPKDDFYYAY